ncbi:MAG: hypothetical protein COA79_23580 [Planctomycetota bacterium]|nr:MAG: hypothetical protein COA79_23580 [Planctomycetota bacterium]
MKNSLDNIGITLSILCAVHCLVLPLFLVLLPTIGLSFLLNETAEKVFIGCSILFALMTLIFGYRIHREKKSFITFTIGSVMLIVATFGFNHSHFINEKKDSHAKTTLEDNKHHEEHGHAHEGHHHAEEKHLTINSRPQDSSLGLFLLVIGALFLASSHFINRSLCNKCLGHKHSGNCNHSHSNETENNNNLIDS